MFSKIEPTRLQPNALNYAVALLKDQAGELLARADRAYTLDTPEEIIAKVQNAKSCELALKILQMYQDLSGPLE